MEEINIWSIIEGEIPPDKEDEKLELTGKSLVSKTRRQKLREEAITRARRILEEQIAEDAERIRDQRLGLQEPDELPF